MQIQSKPTTCYQTSNLQAAITNVSGLPVQQAFLVSEAPKPSETSPQKNQVPQQQHQSAQCQTDPVDIKPNINIDIPVKREVISPAPMQLQVDCGVGMCISPRDIKSPSIKQQQQQQLQQPQQLPLIVQQAQQQQQVLPAPPMSSPSNSPRQGVKRAATSPIRRQVNRTELIEQQLKTDQAGATAPDVNTPFSSKRDACKRLVRYHCLNEHTPTAKDLAKSDELFEETAKHLLSKFQTMMTKYSYLLLMEGTRDVRTSECTMINRMLIAEEEASLERLREQEARLSEELKREERLKLEPDLGLADGVVAVKRELENDLADIELPEAVARSCKGTTAGSGDYDEWLEIQKELGVFENTTKSGGKTERPRPNGARESEASATSTTSNTLDRRWGSVTDLERDLLEDTDSLDGLALHSQAQQCSSANVEEGVNDDITAQVMNAFFFFFIITISYICTRR